MLILVAARLVFSFAPSPNLTPSSLSRFKDQHVCVGLQQCVIFSLSLLDMSLEWNVMLPMGWAFPAR